MISEDKLQLGASSQIIPKSKNLHVGGIYQDVTPS